MRHLAFDLLPPCWVAKRSPYAPTSDSAFAPNLWKPSKVQLAAARILGPGYLGVSQTMWAGALVESPYHRNHSTLGSILGHPVYGTSTNLKTFLGQPLGPAPSRLAGRR